MKITGLLVAVAVIAVVSRTSFAQDAVTANATAPAALASQGVAVVAPAPAVVEATPAAAAPPPAFVYAPVRSFNQWVRDLPHDPWLLVGFIFSLASGLGFLFIIYTTLFELIMGIPYKKQSFILGGTPTQNPLAAVH